VTGAARHQAAETATLAVLGALGVGVAVVGSGYGISVNQRTGPGFLPLVAGVGLALMCAALLLAKLRGSGASDRNTAVQIADTNAADLAEDAPEEETNRTRNHPARLVFGGLIVTIVLVSMIGFLESFALLLMFVSVVVERRPVLPALGVTAVAVAVIYLVFVQLLSVRLPMGLLAIVGA
jgi:putative tricarboxylic transport membrane protein